MKSSTRPHALVLTGEASCRICAYYDEQSGECRRYPAAVSKTPNQWCGQLWPDRQTELRKGYVFETADGTVIYGAPPVTKGDG